MIITQPEEFPIHIRLPEAPTGHVYDVKRTGDRAVTIEISQRDGKGRKIYESIKLQDLQPGDTIHLSAMRTGESSFDYQVTTTPAQSHQSHQSR